MRKILLAAITFLALQGSAWAHNAEEELGHHWEIPAYRMEMMTQIALMTGTAIAVVAGLWLRENLRKRRARQ